MIPEDTYLSTRLAESEADLMAAQRLRYRVFVEELGGDGPLVDHERRLETDRFDPFFDHLVLVDARRNVAALDHVVGVYRLMPGERVARAGQFYSADEFDLGVLTDSGRKLLELGRSCVDPAYRGGSALYLMWNALAEYVLAGGYEVLFGTASFHGTDVEALAAPLSLLWHRHLAPEDLRVRTRKPRFQAMDLMAENDIDKVAAMRAVPALIKGYLRLGGFVGDGAYVDQAFNTTDICLVMDTGRINAKTRAIYTGARA